MNKESKFLESKFISLVVYMYNEQERIEVFLEKVVLFCAEHFTKFELICVNDECRPGFIH